MSQQDLKGELEFELPIGYKVSDEYTRSIVLLKTNGIAEEVFAKKLSNKPFTWIANVITIATNLIGETPVGNAARELYSKDKSVLIPQVVKKMPMADANSMLVEIHRRVWQSTIPKQSIICKFCGTGLVADINLSKITMGEENQEKLVGNPEIEFSVCDLKEGFIVDTILDKMKKTEFEYLRGVVFNRLTFRIPTLGDAIKNEAHASDSILFWRRLAQDCLVAMERVEDGKVVSEFPPDYFAVFGLDLYKTYLDAEDLKSIRHSIREDIPTMPFTYTDTCPCERMEEIPFAMEATGFFSE